MSLSHREPSDRVFIAIVLGLFAVLLLALAWWQSSPPELKLPAPAAIKPVQPEPRPKLSPGNSVSAPSAAPASASTGAIYRCEQAGRVIYQDSPCAGGRALSVQHSAGVNLPRHAALGASENKVVTEVPMSAEIRDRESPACPALAEHIRALDARARQRLSSVTQDRIREERRQAFDRWAALKCHSPIE